MKLYAGTSGYSYKEWKGSFYPDKLPPAKMLQFYAQHLPAVEINNTFYRLPKVAVLASWAEQVPQAFRFSIKASRRITHIKRLKEAHDETAYLLHTVETLGSRLGVILFQLLTGELPFRGNVRMLLHQVINDEPPSPRSLNPRIPRDLETICLRCLEKEPGRRYATAAAVG
ncbi:MAG: DUF72 domain-containing protein, partial [Acidiferrobacterales bacterium]|nr:DUF72 domain-containing protein [Acidiferrobacterales bacterium]